MKPIEPFKPAKSSRPPAPRTVPGEFVTLSIGVGAHTIDDLHRELGIPIAELKPLLRELVAAGFISECALGYYPKPLNIVIHAGDWAGDEVGY